MNSLIFFTNSKSFESKPHIPLLHGKGIFLTLKKSSYRMKFNEDKNHVIKVSPDIVSGLRTIL